MAKLYVDTNKFMSFYQSSKESLVVLNSLDLFASSYVTTTQTIDEFRRNRVERLNLVLRDFKKSFDVSQGMGSALIRELPGFDELSKFQLQFRKKGEELVIALQELIDDESKDPVANKFFGLLKASEVKALETTDDIVRKAEIRKLRGNPPLSENKYSVGDEAIWETLLTYVESDLILVSDDHTFLDNEHLLKLEWKKRIGKELVLVTKLISEATKAMGTIPSPQIIEEEKKVEDQWGRFAELTEDWYTKSLIEQLRHTYDNSKFLQIHKLLGAHRSNLNARNLPELGEGNQPDR